MTLSKDLQPSPPPNKTESQDQSGNGTRDYSRLQARSLLHIGVGTILIGLMLFVPAGSTRYWQGWAFTFVACLAGSFYSLYFLKRDPKSLERRLRSKEQLKEQKLFVIPLYLCMPVALGSYVALPAFALLVPLIIFRLLNEEALLLRELPGYADYCLRTRFRLLPFVW